MICLVSHDAGGAELLSCWAKRQNHRFIYNIKGPAIKIFKNNLRHFKNSTKNIYKKKITKIITSTSKYSDHEIKFIKYGNKKKIKTISILDHWVNYKKRFIRNRKLILPKEIWVTDKHACNIAKSTFNTKIILKKNYYINEIKKNFQKSKKKNENKIVLYLCSNIKNSKIEKKRIKYFLKYYNFFKKKKLKIVFKIHPSEKIEKYNWVKNKFNGGIFFHLKSDLINLIMKSKYVVGCNSMAMFIAHKLKKEVFDGLPPSDIKNLLPIKKIKKLKSIKKL